MNHLRLFRLPRFLAPWDRYLPVMWTVCVGVAFSLAVFCTVRWWEYQDIAKIFQLAAEDRALAVKGTFGTEAAMLELVRSSLDGDAHPRRNEFRRLVTPFLSHSRSIEAVEWVPRVAESERAGRARHSRVRPDRSDRRRLRHLDPREHPEEESGVAGARAENLEQVSAT